MVDTGQMPPEAAKRYRQNQQKEARRSLRLTLGEVDALEGQIADAVNALDRGHRELATRLTRIERDISRLLGDDGAKP
jgi:polyhydroxyalkanoate synthesis regulator phasin